jgi:hypothetical protein
MAKIRKNLFTRPRKTHGKQIICDCPSLIYDGLGRWINGTWEPFSQGKVRRNIPVSRVLIVRDGCGGGSHSVTLINRK